MNPLGKRLNKKKTISISIRRREQRADKPTKGGLSGQCRRWGQRARDGGICEGGGGRKSSYQEKGEVSIAVSNLYLWLRCGYNLNFCVGVQ